MTICTRRSNKFLKALSHVPHNKSQDKAEYNMQVLFCWNNWGQQGYLKALIKMEIFTKSATKWHFQLTWPCFCTASLGTFAQTAIKSTAFIMAVWTSVRIYRCWFYWTDFRQIWYWVLYGNLLINTSFGWNRPNMSPIAIRRLSHVTAARIRCVVFGVLYFA